MISSGSIPQGPYRATKLWNEVVRLFQAGIPTKKHRHLLKTYDDCFTAAEAIEWLHSLLKANRNFGSQVTRQQTIQLLKKFLKNHVFEDIQGSWGSENFSDNNQLYRFPVANSPSKSIRQPLALIPTNAATKVEEKSFKKPTTNLYKSTPNLSKISTSIVIENNGGNGDKPQSANMVGSKLQQDSQLSAEEMNGVWKKSLLVCLRRVLHLENATDIFPGKQLNGEWIQHNSTQLAPSGVVHVTAEHELPCWLLSAMKCLAGWPDSTDSGLPNYEGFEKDVFKAIHEYFRAMPDALTTQGLYEIFTTLLVRGELLDEMCRGHSHTVTIQDPKPNPQSEAELEKIHKKLIQAQMRHENIAVRRQKSGRAGRKLFKPEGISSAPMLCPRHAGLEANNNKRNPLQRNHSLMENRSKNKMSSQYQSTPALDVLDEETSFQFVQDQSLSERSSVPPSVNNNIAASLPELRISEHNVSTHKNGAVENYVNLSFQHNVFQTGPEIHRHEEEIFSSVEDLLLNMSHTMRNELELDLMREADEDAQEEDVNNDIFSPPYRSMKPLPVDKIPPRIHLTPFRDQIPVKYPSEKIPVSEDSSSSSGDPYMEMLPRMKSTDEELSPSAFDMYNKMNGEKEKFRSMPRITRKISPAGVGRVYSVRNAELRNNRKPHGGVAGLIQVRPKSDIIERREVPPTESGQHQTNAHHIKSRIMRLPYVSLGSSDGKLSGPSLKDVAGKFERLSRSYSSLHPRRKTCPPQPLPPSSEFQPDAAPLLRHKSASRPSVVTPFQPQSPLSAALDLARKQRVAIGEQQGVRPHSTEAFQLCLLLLPPSNRRKLHLLLRLLSKMLSNPHLITFDEHLSLRSMLIQKFTSCIVRPRDVSDDVGTKLSERVFCFMLDHAAVLMKVPDKLREEVQSQIQRTVADKENMKKDTFGRKKLSRQHTFCKQVSNAEYESHSQSTLRTALTELLQKIVEDKTISVKEKKKKLKQFQKSYPGIYKARFPQGHPRLNSAPQKKQPLLTGAIQRLRNLRL